MFVYKMARDGMCESWQDTPDGMLALCIVLDQFPRNMFRGDPAAYATDGKALLAAKMSVARKYDLLLPAIKRRFLYLPFEHSESLADQQKSVALFEAIREDDPQGYDYARKHLEVIEIYGRFPHRNAILGRENTPEEDAYLAQPGAGF